MIVFSTRRVGWLSVAICCIILSGGLSPAQTGSRSYPVGRRVQEQNRQAEQYDREDRSRSGEREGPVGRRRNRTTEVQVREDFGSIQNIYNEIVLGMSAGKALDDNFISDALEGINRSASRLRNNLALPRIDHKERHQKKQDEIAEAKLSTSLTLLCGHISNFVTNPLFESSGVLDVELSIKASRDLDEIIELSENLSKKRGKLKPE